MEQHSQCGSPIRLCMIEQDEPPIWILVVSIPLHMASAVKLCTVPQKFRSGRWQPVLAPSVTCVSTLREETFRPSFASYISVSWVQKL